MTRQKEIKKALEGVYLMPIPEQFNLTTPKQIAAFRAEYAISVLDELGVVIKAERELPDSPYKHRDLDEFWHTLNKGYSVAQRDMIEEGYVAVGPLMGEKDEECI